MTRSRWLSYFSDEVEKLRPEVAVVNRPGLMQWVLLLPQISAPGALLAAAAVPHAADTLFAFDIRRDDGVGGSLTAAGS